MLVEETLERQPLARKTLWEQSLQPRIWGLLLDIECELFRRSHRDRPERHIGGLLDHRLLHATHPEGMIRKVNQVVQRLPSLVRRHAEWRREPRDRRPDDGLILEQERRSSIRSIDTPHPTLAPERLRQRLLGVRKLEEAAHVTRHKCQEDL